MVAELGLAPGLPRAATGTAASHASLRPKRGWPAGRVLLLLHLGLYPWPSHHSHTHLVPIMTCFLRHSPGDWYLQGLGFGEIPQEEQNPCRHLKAQSKYQPRPSLQTSGSPACSAQTPQVPRTNPPLSPTRQDHRARSNSCCKGRSARVRVAPPSRNPVIHTSHRTDRTPKGPEVSRGLSKPGGGLGVEPGLTLQSQAGSTVSERELLSPGAAPLKYPSLEVSLNGQVSCLCHPVSSHIPLLGSTSPLCGLTRSL